MDRRGFLKGLGLGAVAIAAAPRLVLPPSSTSIATPERRVFTPPPGGWRPNFDWTVWGRDAYVRRIPGGDTVYVDLARGGGYLVPQDMLEEVLDYLAEERRILFGDPTKSVPRGVLNARQLTYRA